MFTKIAPLMWKDEDDHTYTVQELLELGYHFIDGEPFLPLSSAIVLSAAEDGAKQVRFRCVTDEDVVPDHDGILVGHYLICGDCGGVWDLNYDFDEVTIFEIYEDWADISESLL